MALRGRISSLAMEARTVSDDQRAGVAAALNALMPRLPSEMAPAEGAAFLHRLLEEGLLDGLEDEEGLPTSIVATRVLLELGYPHALEVAPERLEALRRWRRRPLPVPWLGILLTQFLAFIAQVAFITLGAQDHHFYKMTVGVLSGLAYDPDPPMLELISRRMHASSGEVFVGQLLTNFAAFLMAVTVGWWQRGYGLTRRVFLGLAALGLLVGSLQWTVSGWLAMCTWVGAAASLVSGRMMKER